MNKRGKKEKRKGRNISWVFRALMGIISVLAVLVILVVIWMVISRFCCDTDDPVCFNPRMRIINVSAADNSVTLNRMAGYPEVNVVDFMIMVDETRGRTISPQDKSITELETKTYIFDYDIKTGDTVEVAPVILDGKKRRTCDVIGQTRAF